MRTHGVMWWLGIAAICFLSLTAVVSGQDGAKLETLAQYTRLQIPVTSGTSFRMLSGKSGEVTLMVDRVASGALDSLATFNDSRVQQVQVKNLGLDKAEVTVRFREAATESFAYRQGNVLVLDLWHGTPAKVEKPAMVAKALPATVKHVNAGDEARAPASAAHAPTKPAKVVKAQVSTVDPLRIEKDLFLKFLLPMPELTITAKDGGIDLPPKFELEERWKFSAGDKKTDDGKAFEFAKSLFTAKKYGLCLKTIEIALRDFPQSKNADEFLFLRALAYKKLGQSTKADFLVARSDQMLEELAARRDEEGQPLPFNRLIVLSFAQKELQKQNWLAAIQHLEYVSSVTKAKDADFPYVQMMLAEAYSQVKQPRRAERIYRFLTERLPKHELAKESAYRIADLLAIEKNYSRVTEEGEAAIRAYPDYEKSRSEVLFHIGEAYFWLGQYANAEKYFRRFTSIASAQTNASLAWVRLGEIEEVHRRNTKAAHANYMRAKNGYPFSKGDLVATVRLARLDLPIEKEPNFVVRTLREMLLDQTLDWELKRMAELTLADYLMVIGEIEKSIAIANSGMAQTDGLVYGLYKGAYERGLFARLSRLTKEKKYSEALALYDRERKWLEQYGPDTYRVVAEVYRGLGLFASANKQMERYASELAAKGRAPASVLINRDKAANSFARGDYKNALEELGGQKDAVSTYYQAVSHYRLGHKQDAYSAADRALPMMKAAKEHFTDDMVENIAEILIDRATGDRDFARMQSEVQAARALCAKDNERLMFAAADALWYQKLHKEAEKAYKEALEKYPSGIRADRGRYNRGMSLVALGKRDEAVKLLTELRDSGQSVWAESAKQELELIEWERKYSSVLRTLPPAGLGIAN